MTRNYKKPYSKWAPMIILIPISNLCIAGAIALVCWFLFCLSIYRDE